MAAKAYLDCSQLNIITCKAGPVAAHLAISMSVMGKWMLTSNYKTVRQLADLIKIYCPHDCCGIAGARGHNLE